MEKQTINKFKNKFYLLGKDKDGRKVWLQEASWDCDWYWGLGYINTFNKNYSDIDLHTHFDSLFLKKDIYKSFVNYFTETTLNKSEIWQLLELMKTLYTLGEYSDMLHLKGANISKNSCENILKNDEEYKRINEVVIPELNNKVYELLSN